MTHPGQFSKEIITELATLFERHGIRRVFDPFAGPGNRLAALCDECECSFAGCDIEDWEGRDLRVSITDATLLDPLLLRDAWIVTSPTYGNGINDHFKPKDDSKRYTYRVALGRPLHENNSGRYSIRGGTKAWDKYWEINEAAVARWTQATGAIVNVKDFIAGGDTVQLGMEWSLVLQQHAGFNRCSRIKVRTPGNRNGANAEARADGEWLIVATR